MSKPTLEQRRARDTWEKSDGCSKDYVNLVKSLPALIMNSGLMQVMAFLHEKSSGKADGHHAAVALHLREWLSKRFSPRVRPEFPDFMDDMMKADPRMYQDVTAEAFAWLRWMRQMAPSRLKEN